MKKRSRIQFVELSNRQQFAKKMIFYDEVINETLYNLREPLKPFIPENALDEVVAMLEKHHILLRVETPRKESLGYYNWGNIIGINKDLDKDRFLSVFIHEYAHLLTHLSFPKVAAHGSEFYFCFQELVLKFINNNIIHKDMFLSIVNKTGDYEFYKKNNGFKFKLKTIKVGTHAIYMNEKIIRGKGRKGLIDCTKLSDNAIIKLNEYTDVQPIFDLCW